MDAFPNEKPSTAREPSTLESAGKVSRPFLRRPGDRRFDLGFRKLTIFNLLFWFTVYTTWAVGGPWFSLGLLLILGTHEFGHYLACRKNDVDSSLPYFIPAPPFFLVGTFGAFIKIKEPIPDRRALMEIGAAGPIAGFVAAVPVLAIGIALSDVYPAMQVPGYNLGDSLITFLFSKAILGVTSYDEAVTIMVHPVAYAGWFGMFITAMNLLPIGQLDRGHVIYSLFPRHHVWVGIVFFVALLIMGWGWPGWFVFSGLILLMGFRHPPLLEDEPDLKRRHLWMGYACILIFLATIIPIPIEVIGG